MKRHRIEKEMFDAMMIDYNIDRLYHASGPVSEARDSLKLRQDLASNVNKALERPLSKLFQDIRQTVSVVSGSGGRKK